MESYLSQEMAKKFDEWLMSPEGASFTLEQLMELAGLAAAQAFDNLYPMRSTKTLIVCGPGNNGGDGLVMARHLAIFGHEIGVYYPKPGKHEHYSRLVRQCEFNDIPVSQELTSFDDFDVIIDAIFGFGFKGSLQAPFDQIIADIIKSGKPVVSIDVPTGWDVQAGPEIGSSQLQPETLISLMMPKVSAKYFRGKNHILAGRFIPKIHPNQDGNQ